jgi:hypothetical protein
MPPEQMPPTKGMGIKGPAPTGHGIKGPPVHAAPKASQAKGPYKALGKSPKAIKPKPPAKGA